MTGFRRSSCRRGSSPRGDRVTGGLRPVRACEAEEELEEYLSSGDVAEVADLVEVCFAAAALHGVGQDELLAIARAKRQQRGGFDSRLVWMGNLPGDHEPPAGS